MTFDPEQQSVITFGGIPDFVDIDSLDKAVSHRVAGDDHWMLKLNDIKVGNSSIKPKANFALTDTASTLLYLDPDDFFELIEKVCLGLDCFETVEEANVFAIKDCEPDDLPFIWLKIDRHEYKLAPQAYIISVVYPDETHDCMIQFRKHPSQMGYALLGIPFLMNYF